MALSPSQEAELEAIHSKEGFCHQCGSTNIVPLEWPYDGFRCLDCGSSDADE